MDHAQPAHNNFALQADTHAQRLEVGKIERAKSRAWLEQQKRNKHAAHV